MGTIGRYGARVAAFGFVFLWIVAGEAKAQQAPLITLPGHVLQALSRATPLDARLVAKSSSIEPVALTVVLRRTDPAGFDRYLADVYDPKSANFRKFLTPAQIAERFGPSAQDYDAVASYFAARGFERVETSANRLTLTVRAPRATVEQALAVHLSDYQIGQKRFVANDRDPSLPSDVASRVESITGLSSLATPRADFGSAGVDLFCRIVTILTFIQNIIPDGYAAWNAATQQCRKDVIKGGGFWVWVWQIKDPPPPAWQGVDGSGQTVGIVAFSTFQASDVGNFIHLNGLPSTLINNLSNVHVGGGATSGAVSDETEVLLDIDTVMATARGANVVVYDAPFSGAGSFQAVFNAMINGGVTVISNSFAYCEDETTLADVQGIETILQTAAGAGISVVSASGDHGSTCLDGAANTLHVPADVPHVTAVGGTSAQFAPGHVYGSETWWDASSASPPGGQGGFGVSKFFARPAYQNGLDLDAMRSVPDIALNADPSTMGVEICQADAGGCPTGLFYGGTSVAAPRWAAYVALLNQSQGSNLGFLNQAIYPLAATDAFHDAASMGSDFAHVGLGSPNVNRLHQHLTSQTPGSGSASISEISAYYPPGTFPMLDGSTFPADGATQAFVTVHLGDANGNLVSGKTVQLAANGGSSAVITPSTVVTDPDTGAAVFRVSNLSFEPVVLTATDVTDGVVLDQTFTIHFVPPPAASGGIGASPSPLPSDGTSTTTITVTLKDSLGRASPGKLIKLDQGAGHSIVVGPSPALTDASGQIHYTASDGVSESVTYTALDVTDNNVPVPGSATVDFTGGTTSCVGAPPTAGAGFTITPWATGFFAENFFYGGVNWGGCGGASNPTFDSSGGVFVADFPSGDLFKFGLAGGAAAGSKLSNLTPTLTQPTFGKDGRLYAAHGSTGGGFTTGDIVEIDPATGAQIRVVASNLTCPNGLSIDPLSGDLFFDDDCFGAGSDNPSIWRIHDPGGAATLGVYATLPTTPSGQMAFSPDGTLYAVTGYTNVEQVVQIGGTNTAQPPSMTTLSGISSFFCLTMGEAQGSGAAKSLIVCNSSGVELVDITTSPFTSTVLISSGGSGTIGPDGCLYSGNSDTVYKLTEADGSCGFVPTNPAPLLALAPASSTPAQGAAQSLTATFRNVSVPVGTPVLFSIVGVNSTVKLGATDASGAATISYSGSLAGTDNIVASGPAGGSTLVSNPASVAWGAGKHLTFLDLTTSPSSGIANQAVTLSAALSDLSLSPVAAISGAAVHFTLGSQSCDGTTNAAGVASCSVTPPAPGQFVLTASYAGSATYAPASATEGFSVVLAAGAVSAPGAPTITGVSGGDGAITVFFSPPASDGGSPITSYTAGCTSTTGGAPGTQAGNGSPITVSGLTNGATYTCTVAATNATGPGAPSGASGGVTLQQPSSSRPQPIPALDRANVLLLAALLGLLGGALLRRPRRRRPRATHGDLR